MRKRRFIPALLILYMTVHASITFASVRINEIAWMGTATSANDEWIELYNDGTSSAAVEGWHLKGKDGAPNIALKGTIDAEGFYLIERTSDATVPNIDADLVASFGKGLSNAGETLVLSDASGTPVDTVVGGKDWSKIGGNNDSKQTAQRLPAPTGSASGWITAAPTPRATNRVLTPTPAKVVSSTISPAVPKTALLAGVAADAPLAQPKVETIPVVQKESPIATDSAASVIWQNQAGTKKGFPAIMILWSAIAVTLFIVATVIIMRTEVAEPSEADTYAIIEDIIEGSDGDTKEYLDKAIWDE